MNDRDNSSHHLLLKGSFSNHKLIAPSGSIYYLVETLVMALWTGQSASVKTSISRGKSLPTVISLHINSESLDVVMSDITGTHWFKYARCLIEHLNGVISAMQSPDAGQTNLTVSLPLQNEYENSRSRS